jgi:hypothetical protein
MTLLRVLFVACLTSILGACVVSAKEVIDNPLPPIPQDHLWALWEVQVKTNWTTPEGGYADRFGVVAGETIGFHLSSTRREQTLFVFREGEQRQLVHELPDVRLDLQPVNPDEPYAKGFGWVKTLDFEVPAHWRSGVYVLQFLTGLGVREVPFVVRQPESGAEILWVVSDMTFQAYNPSGGKSSYNYQSTDRVRSNRHSLDRPFPLDGTGSWLLRSQQFLQWVDREGLNVDFCGQWDVVQNPELLSRYKCIIRVGHDEYWSTEELEALHAYWQAGGNIAFFSANNIYWRIRYEDDGRTIVCYKNAASWPPGTTEKEGRDPVHWEQPELDTDLFVNLPDPIRAMALELRGVAGTGMVNFMWKENNDRWWPGQFTVGERALGLSSGHGGFTARYPEHWIFEGTGLEQGEQFGHLETICGTEVDYLDMEWREGRPYPTGKDGISTEWEILATAQVVRYLEKDIGDGAMVYRPAKDGRGHIFYGSTLQWGHGLETNEALKRITYNVLTAFTE